MNKFIMCISIAYLIIMVASAIFYLPVAERSQIAYIKVTDGEDTLNIKGEMNDGYKYRGYKINVLSDTYFVTIRRGLVGVSEFDFDINKNQPYTDSGIAKEIRQLYLIDNDGNRVLIFEK